MKLKVHAAFTATQELIAGLTVQVDVNSGLRIEAYLQ